MKMHNASAQRNRDEILVELKNFLPQEGTVLEISSGCGVHCSHFAPHFPNLTWQPTELNPDKIVSLRLYREESGAPNLLAPLKLDTCSENWPLQSAEAMVNINMIHAAPWEACLGLLKGSARTLTPGAPLFMYGPYLRSDRETVPSNLEFDRRLRAKDPSWGLRQLETVIEKAEEAGLKFEQVLDVPNNNCVVIYRR
ncbi:MAG: DUF938 domain-containing protein [Planctomycetota bacterium]|nr:DUF938 domain-containing protein [Planctomycetota bacterium]